MSAKIRDRHLYGVGAAACAVCCAAPLLALLGIAGAGAVATVATIAFAGLAFGLVVLAATVLGIWARRRRNTVDAASRCSDMDPVHVTIGAAPDDIA